MPLGLLKLAIPMIFGMLGLVVFNLTDTFFVGQLGSDQLAALSFTFPVVLFINSISIGIGLGSSALISRHVGEQNEAMVKRLATDSLMLGITFLSVVVVIGLLTVRSLFSLMGAEGVVLDSLYVQNTEQLLTHLDSVARILPSGGLYLLDWCIDFQPLSNTKETWVAREGNTAIQVTYSTYLENAAQQTFREDIVLNITEGSQRFRLTNSTTRRAIYPQEFLLLLALNGQFEFVGWFDDWDYSRPVDACRKVDRSTTIIWRKDQ